MSKRSRRRRRQARLREPIRVTPGMVIHDFTGTTAAFRDLRQHLPQAMDSFSLRLKQLNVMLNALNSPWGKALAEACRRRDSLPLLVYADWCDENGCPQAARQAREVAAEFARDAVQQLSPRPPGELIDNPPEPRHVGRDV